MSLSSTTISSVPIHDFAIANEELAKMDMEKYYPCVAGSTFVVGAYTLTESLEMKASVRFEILMEVAKLMKIRLQK
jgi:hypothetical protein